MMQTRQALFEYFQSQMLETNKWSKKNTGETGHLGISDQFTLKKER